MMFDTLCVCSGARAGCAVARAGAARCSGVAEAMSMGNTEEAEDSHVSPRHILAAEHGNRDVA